MCKIFSRWTTNVNAVTSYFPAPVQQEWTTFMSYPSQDRRRWLSPSEWTTQLTGTTRCRMVDCTRWSYLHVKKQNRQCKTGKILGGKNSTNFEVVAAGCSSQENRRLDCILPFVFTAKNGLWRRVKMSQFWRSESCRFCVADFGFWRLIHPLDVRLARDWLAWIKFNNARLLHIFQRNGRKLLAPDLGRFGPLWT